MNQAYGIDVSRHQGEIDWQRAAKAGVQFAFIKATEGQGFVDPLFATNWAAARQAGVLRGAYHFYRARRDPLAQALHFVKTVRREATDLPLVLDVEKNEGLSPQELAQGVKACLEAIEKQSGRRPILYTYPSFWNQEMPADFGAWPLWIAHYRTQSPTVPRGWTDWTFWQNSDSGQVDGIPHPVDTNLFRGSFEQLQAFVREGAPITVS